MADIKNRLYRLDDDSVSVTFTYDEAMDMYFGDYPDFSDSPRITPNGRPWVNVTADGCLYADEEYGDCGSCKFFRCEAPGDLIGICENENLLQEKRPDTAEKGSVV